MHKTTGLLFRRMRDTRILCLVTNWASQNSLSLFVVKIWRENVRFKYEFAWLRWKLRSERRWIYQQQTIEKVDLDSCTNAEEERRLSVSTHTRYYWYCYWGGNNDDAEEEEDWGQVCQVTAASGEDAGRMRCGCMRRWGSCSCNQHLHFDLTKYSIRNRYHNKIDLKLIESIRIIELESKETDWTATVAAEERPASGVSPNTYCDCDGSHRWRSSSCSRYAIWYYRATWLLDGRVG